WPFAWYLRDYKNMSYVGTLNSPPDQPVVITAADNDAADKSQLSNYVGNRYKLRWWFSEDYRDLTLPKAAQSITDPAMRKTLWNWLTLRETPSPPGSYDFDLWIRKDLAPGLVSNFESLQRPQQAALRGAAPIADGPDPFGGRTEKIASLQQIGSGGQADGQVSGSRGVAVAPDGSLYVADMDNNRIEKFDVNGKFLLKWGSTGKGVGEFASPSGVALDQHGNLWVTDLWNHRVQEFDRDGKFLLEFGVFAAATGKASPGGFFGPRGVAISPQGDVYVTDTGNKRVQKYSPQGTLVTMWGQPGTGPGQFGEPIGIAVDQEGNVYVADTWNRRIQKFDANGAFQAQISVGSWPGAQTSYGEPFLAIEPNGTILATDPLRARVLAFSATGSLQQAWGGSGNDPSSLAAPTGIAVEPNGQVLVSDTLNKRLLVFPAPAFPSPSGRGSG
ncbi:MAG: NHL repeat-containing protein, partial [Chloroflexota bacterium]|nr:NHL repeat-containing protein [Chloroflexota bacterium]